ncbi:MAG: polysaccharide pyruvyl transferase family protein [Trueperaceae bacterium]
MPTIGIVGSYGGLNTGDEAIFTCLSREIRRVIPDARLVVFSRNAEHTRDNYTVYKVVPVRELTREEVAQEVRALDLLVLGGGGILFDAEVLTFLREVRLAQQFNIPTFAASVGAGPLSGREGREAARVALDDMRGITVRDMEAKRLLEEIGVARDIEVTADPAWLLEPEPFTDEMLLREGINSDTPLVGFSIREPGGAAPGLDESEYHRLLADAADFAVERYQTDIVFVPMERADIRHAHQVIADMTNAEQATVLKGSYPPSQVLGLVSRFRLAVGMRLHFLIFCALSRVPFLPLPYAGKVSSMMQALELPVESMVQEGRAGRLLASVDRLWDGREERREHLEGRVPELQDRARRTVALLHEVLDGTSGDTVPRAGAGG